jgi:anti-sigma factor RsiW
MTCDDARPLLLDAQRGLLPPERDRELALHLETCRACAQARSEEAVLTVLLGRRLPQYPASPALKRRLAALAPAARPPAPVARLAPRRWARTFAPALAAAAVVLVAGALVLGQRQGSERAALAALTTEAVNDHLRVLQLEHPVDLVSGAMHQVKPWFEGKLDFAPAVPAPVAPDMTLEGGSVGWFMDRKAAVVVYRLRRHVVTLLVFRADGLPGAGADALVDGRPPLRRSLRGFDAYLWRSGELGHALVADVDPTELSGIAARLAAETRAGSRTGG